MLDDGSLMRYTCPARECVAGGAAEELMSRDMIVGRRGDSILGRVLDRSFSIRAAFGRITVEAKRITWVHLRDSPDLAQDEIWLKTGDHLTGAVEITTVNFRTDGGEVLKIPREAIHSILIGAGFSARARRLR